MKYKPKREVRYDELIAANKHHNFNEVIRAVLNDLLHAEACIKARDEEIANLRSQLNSIRPANYTPSRAND